MNFKSLIVTICACVSANAGARHLNLPEAVQLAQKLAKKAPLALGMAKAVLRACVDTDMTSGHTLEMLAQNVLMDSKDHSEGVRAFLEKREAKWTGH